eukprot:3901291-Pleurochrysis_carterae.AAC.3
MGLRDGCVEALDDGGGHGALELLAPPAPNELPPPRLVVDDIGRRSWCSICKSAGVRSRYCICCSVGQKLSAACELELARTRRAGEQRK